MQAARLFLLYSVAAVLGACSADSTSSAGAASTSDPAADTAAIVVQVDSTKSTPRPIPENVPSTEYAAPPRKATPPAEE